MSRDSDWMLGPAEVVALVNKGAWPRLGFAFVSALVAGAVAPLTWLAGWLAIMLAWEVGLRPYAERAFLTPGQRTESQFHRLAAINLVGATAYTVLPALAWTSGEPLGMVLAAAWISGSANHAFVYFSSNRVLLIANLAPLAVCVLLAPLATDGFTLTSALSVIVLASLVAAAGIFGYDRRILLKALASNQAARVAAEQANAFKSHFLANLGHELRTPLNSVIGYAELIAEEATPHADDAGKIASAARQMLSLVNVVIDIARLESGKVTLRPERTQIAAIMEQLRDAALPFAAIRRNQLIFADVRGLGAATIDHSWLHQGLMQILVNCAQGAANGVIRVAASRGVRDGKPALSFEIRDTGEALTAERCAELFEPFRGARGEERGDAGLGLPFARQIARAMGGDALCEPISQGGVKFTFWVVADGAAAGP